MLPLLLRHKKRHFCSDTREVHTAAVPLSKVDVLRVVSEGAIVDELSDVDVSTAIALVVKKGFHRVIGYLS